MAIGTPVVIVGDAGAPGGLGTDTTAGATTNPVDLGSAVAFSVDDILAAIMRTTRGSSTMTGSPAVTHAGVGGAGFTRHIATTMLDGTNRQKVSVFTGKADATTSDQFSTDSGETANNTSRQIVVLRIPGAHKTTPVPTNQFAQATAPDDADGNVSVSLPSAPTAGSITVAWCWTNVPATKPAVPSGWTELVWQTNTAPDGGLLVCYHPTGAQTAAFTGGLGDSANDMGAGIIEIAPEPTSGAAAAMQQHEGAS